MSPTPMPIKRTLERDTLKVAVAANPEFSAMPRVAVPVITMFNDPDASFQDLAAVIETSPDLTERVLTIANSGYYGFRRKVTSVERAVVLLGWNAVKMITLGSTILKRMHLTDQRLNDHSLRTAVIARYLAMEAGFYKVEEIAVVGLLHDIGQIILESCFPEQAARVKQYIIDHGVPRHVAEREIIGVDHGRVGGWMLEEWNLPKNITSSVMWHHDYLPRTYHARKTAVIHVADVLAQAADVRGPSWEKVPVLSGEALETLQFTEAEFRDTVTAMLHMRLDPLIM